ncbi:MAG: orotidine-5'-phosphate decarboxylase [Peptococcaceae bacterium]|nr:orotidine-5'-phosphate decarboxylase [Peptococcaceae bacterium]
MSGNAADRLIVALDVSTGEKALELADRLKPCAGMFKVGMELFYSAGGDIVKELKNKGCRVFLDLKLHDIPNTVAGAARAITGLGPDIINVHAAGGPGMMRSAAEAVRDEAERKKIARPLVIAVTVLTSIDQKTFHEMGINGKIEDFVVSWSEMAVECGLDGVVASPAEASMIRKACGDKFVIVTPGVRPAWSGAGDQKRIATPSGAISAGATYIVVGRPITGSADPLGAAGKIIEEIKGCAG